MTKDIKLGVSMFTTLEVVGLELCEGVGLGVASESAKDFGGEKSKKLPIVKT